MTKDEIAVYLNDHLEFFNNYPELLGKIKSIDNKDIPICKSNTLSMSGRLIKRAKEDKEKLQSKLEWFVEVARANKEINQHLFEIERLILKSTQLDQMVKQLGEEITLRFKIPYALLYLVDGGDHYMEHKLEDRFSKKLEGLLTFTDQITINTWFKGELKPVLTSEIKTGSKVFGKELKNIQSECIIPIINRGDICGAIALGATKPRHFHNGLQTEYLERMADRLAIAIDNILLIDRLQIENSNIAKDKRISA
ncbi:MAG: DUF484 family protein [Nitrospina sp.]|jgi:hypothetical protein|nr:DUF484 family protein [Nitrospina sp.]|tara:strand:- start:173 stop:931 length:759 start_codon:yes stop_codon:yes gene_type:complete